MHISRLSFLVFGCGSENEAAQPLGTRTLWIEIFDFELHGSCFVGSMLFSLAMQPRSVFGVSPRFGTQLFCSVRYKSAGTLQAGTGRCDPPRTGRYSGTAGKGRDDGTQRQI